MPKHNYEKLVNSSFHKVTPETFDGMPSKAPMKHYPAFSLNLSDIPIAKKWKVGEMYELKLKVKQTRLEESQNRQRVEFEVHQVAV